MGLAAGVAAVPASLRLAGLVSSDPAAVFPGARASVRIHPDAPAGCRLLLVASGGDGVGRSTAAAAPAGAQVEARVPYPHDDLVPGDYRVHAELCSASGAVLASLDLGTYRVRRFRFSA